ncbi:MAG: S-layer homology domain-containing protein [Clostridia bacterium]|nr:S-layer homology domain-containing protein [Clostridia bacterium]
MKYLRSTAAVIVAVCLLSMLPAQAADTVDSATFITQLAHLQEVFRHGEYWNNYNENGYESSGPNPCPSCDRLNLYSCGGCSDQCGGFYYEGRRIAGQCLGFAYKMGAAIFGGNPITWEKHKQADRLQPGDIIYGNIGPMFDRELANHGVFITDVTEDTVTFADCNWTGPCRIRWGKTVERSKVAACMEGANIYHAPNNAVGALPEIALGAPGKIFTDQQDVAVNWYAPEGGEVTLALSKKGEGGAFAPLITLMPTASPFTVGRLPAGQYALCLTHTDGEETLECNWTFRVYSPKELSFTDVSKKDWFYKNDAVPFAYSEGLFAGMSDTEFGPDGVMSRSMFVTVLGRLAGATVDHSVTTAFTDVPTKQWFSGYVAWAAEQGIVSGLSVTTFAPAAPVTREQICRMLVSYSDFAKLTLSQGAPVQFADADKVSSWAKDSVNACSAAGIIAGFPAGEEFYFKPTDTATRAQVATMIYGFVNNV